MKPKSDAPSQKYDSGKVISSPSKDQRKGSNPLSTVHKGK